MPPCPSRGVGRTQAAAGGEHGCAVAPDGTLWCWGGNRRGQLGHDAGVGTDEPNTLPTQVGNDQDWQSVRAGKDHSCGIRAPGTLWCWGRNRRGQLGHDAGVGTDDVNAGPAQVGSASDWLSIGRGDEHTCGLRAPGTLWCWGDNDRSTMN